VRLEPRGKAAPLGVTLVDGGVNVAVHAPKAERVFFCLFDAQGKRKLARLELPERKNGVHSGFVAGVKAGARYGFRAEGPWQPQDGLRFDETKLLVDPYATALDRPYAFHAGLCERGRDTRDLVPKAIVQAPLPMARREPPRLPEWIYEVPVKAFSMRHPGIAAAKRGTVAALAEPAALEHFRQLGVDTIELMPLMAWIDERHLHALGLANAWGYNPVTFFAPEPRLAPGGFAEIAQTVSTLHDNGIQVLLDVVLNHTGESDAAGPTLSFRGLDNTLWYRHINGAPVNDTGCGNTVALDQPAVAQYAVAALRHWIDVTGIDGFRFDLATVMGRGSDGFHADAPLIRAINADPVLSHSILIAEPWDVGPGGYQLGNFPARWLEWNDRFRDDVRRFWRGDSFSANAFATRLAGSSDVFRSKHPSNSVNFISAHDGFTLADVTRYAQKDNMANGEGNRDGKSGEVTWQGGQVRALLATLFLARGTPMLTAGDEMGRSQQGNNNAYAQDNALTWLDWAEADRTLIDFTRRLIDIRKRHPLLAEDRFLTGDGDADWFGRDGRAPDWASPAIRFLGLVLHGKHETLAIAVNGGADGVDLPLPDAADRWRRLFSSGTGAGCPAFSVSLFSAIST
jgi:glycogen debranching enzyme